MIGRITSLLAAVLSLAAAAPITTPLPSDIAVRLAVRAAAARRADQTVRSYALYSEAAKLDPLISNYRLNRDELEPLAKLLTAEKLGDPDIKADIQAATLEATPGSDANVAVHLADKAELARKSGDAVRAYLLYAEAAKRFPDNSTYAANRNVLAPVAAMLQSSKPVQVDLSADIKAAQLEALVGTNPSIEAKTGEWQKEANLADLPHIVSRPEHHDFDLRADPYSLIQQVTHAFGVRAFADPEVPRTGVYHLQLTDADFRGAMEAITDATGTFTFPVASDILFFAPDTEAKRNELEPNILLTVSLPNAMNEKDLIDVANGVRSVLNLKSFGWDSVNKTVLIRDRFTRAHLAKELLESLLVPHAQVALELQFVTLDSDVAYHWGLSPQTSFQVISPAQKLFNFQTILPTLVSGAQYIAVGGGLSTFGIGVTGAAAFATFSKSITKTIYDTTITVQDGETANLHVGEKYPIPQSIYTGASQSAPSIYNPIGTFTQEDLGLVLKVTPHVKGSGEVSMQIEADYKALGTQTFNTVPAISERMFSGSVTLTPNQWAILAGLDQSTQSRTRDGYPGIGQIPGLNQILSENNREKQRSETLVVLKPVVTELPMSDAITPQFLVGPVHGVRVLL